MKIVLDHDQCQHAGAYADRCLAATMRFPMGHERYCMAEYVEDGEPAITVVLRDAGEESERTFSSEKEMRAAAFEGSLAFSDR